MDWNRGMGRATAIAGVQGNNPSAWALGVQLHMSIRSRYTVAFFQFD